MNKKFFKILLTIMILMIIVLIGSLTLLRYYAPSKDGIVYTENLDRKNLDLVISDYIMNHKAPWDGEDYPTSLKVIFPNKYLVNINEQETLKELNKKMDSQLM